MQSHYEHRQETTRQGYSEVSDSFDSTLSRSTYRSGIQPRVTHLQSSRASGLGSNAGTVTRYFQSVQSSGNFGAGLAGLAHFPGSGVPMRGPGGGHAALVGVNQTRVTEKRELIQLNDKFAQYIEKVRFLEAQNRKLNLELEAMRSRAGQGSSRIKEMYDIEIAEARKLIDDTKRDGAAADAKAQQATQETQRQRARYNEISKLREADRSEIDAIQRKVAENEAQIALFRRRLADLEDEARRYKAESQRLASEIGRVHNEIQNEAFLKASYETEKMALDDELATLKQMHEADLNELRSRQVSNDLDPALFFRNELSQAIKEIRQEYESATESRRAEVQSRFMAMYHEFTIRLSREGGQPAAIGTDRVQEDRIRKDVSKYRNLNGSLQAQNADLKNRIDEWERRIRSLRESDSLSQTKLMRDIEEQRRRLEKAERDYADLTAMRTSLEKEIGDYRNMLDGQAGLKGYVDRIVQSAEQINADRANSLDFRSGGFNTFGARSGGGASSTTISRTYINTGASSSGYGGVGSLITQPSRSSGVYQTISSGYGGTVRGSGGDIGGTTSNRASGDYSSVSSSYSSQNRQGTYSP